MGTFNNVICHYPLPRHEGSSNSFQTKQFSPALHELTITEDGKLTLDGQIVTFHGWLCFYTSQPNEGLIEFFAKFSDGVIEHITTEPPLPQIFFESQ